MAPPLYSLFSELVLIETDRREEGRRRQAGAGAESEGLESRESTVTGALIGCEVTLIAIVASVALILSHIMLSIWVRGRRRGAHTTYKRSGDRPHSRYGNTQHREALPLLEDRQLYVGQAF